MSDKWKLYGVITSSGGNMIGLDGQDLPVWWVDVGLANQRWVGFSVAGAALAVGDVVSIVQCYETNDTWGQVWGLIPYADGQHSVVSVSNYATMRQLEWEYPATCALNWLCNYAGAKQSLYWPGTVTAVGSSSLTVKNRWETFTREVPIDAGLSAGDFSVGDTVLIYSPSPSAEVCVGWWMMQPGESAMSVSITHLPLIAGKQATFTVTVKNTGSRTIYGAGAVLSYLAGSLTDVSETSLSIGTIPVGEAKEYNITATAAGSISSPCGWFKADVTTSTDLTGTATSTYSITQAIIYLIMNAGWLILECRPPSKLGHFANVILTNGSPMIAIYSEDGGDGTYILSVAGEYDTAYSTSITGSVTSYVASALIGKSGGPTYTVTYTLDLSNGEIHLTASIS